MNVFSQALSLNLHEVFSPGQGFVPQKCQKHQINKKHSTRISPFQPLGKSLKLSHLLTIYWSIRFFIPLLIHPFLHQFIDPSSSSPIYWSFDFLTHLLIHPLLHAFIDPSSSSLISQNSQNLLHLTAQETWGKENWFHSGLHLNPMFKWLINLLI